MHATDTEARRSAWEVLPTDARKARCRHSGVKRRRPSNGMKQVPTLLAQPLTMMTYGWDLAFPENPLPDCWHDTKDLTCSRHAMAQGSIAPDKKSLSIATQRGLTRSVFSQRPHPTRTTILHEFEQPCLAQACHQRFQ
jgi:hypothetical protein